MQRRGAVPRPILALSPLGVLVLSLLSLMACSGPAQLSKGAHNTRTVDIPTTGIELGWGWDSYREAPVPSLCIEFVEAVEYGQDIYVTADEVTNKHDLLERLDVSATASVQALGASASAKVEFAQQVQLNSMFSSFVLEARVDNGVKFVSPAPTTRRGRFETKQAQASQYIRRAPFPQGSVRLTEAARELADDDLEAFQFACGDSFVSAIYEGARLYAVITLEDTSRKEQQSWAASMAAGGWGVELGAGAKATEESAKQSKKMKVRIFQSGGSGGELSLDKEGIARMLRELPDKSLRGPKFNRMALTSYDELPDWPAGPLEVEEREFAELTRLWGAYSTLYDELGYILSHSAQFEFGLLPTYYSRTLEALQDDLLQKIGEIRAVASQCSKQARQCEFPEAQFPHPYYYRIWFPPPTEGAPQRPSPSSSRDEWRRYREALGRWVGDYRRRVADYQVREPARQKCAARKTDFGCISNEEINFYEALVTRFSDEAGWSGDDYPVPAFRNRKLRNANDCLAADAQGRLILSPCGSPPAGAADPQRFSLSAAKQLTAGGSCVERVFEGDRGRVLLKPCAQTTQQAWVRTHKGYLRGGNFCLARLPDNTVGIATCANDRTEFPNPVPSQLWLLSN